MDHILGLFSLRESWPLVVYATDAVRVGLEERNAMFRTLRRFPTQLTWKRLELGKETVLEGPAGEANGTCLTVEPVPVQGKLPVHLEAITTPSAEDNVGLVFREANKRAVVLAAAGSVDGLTPVIEGADCVFLDGTFWSSDEMIGLGLSKARASDMAHLPIGGEDGSLRRLAGVHAGRKIFTHINNSNPILVDGSPENVEVRTAGWELAFDGMDVAL
jgi:pyrroloquinoline quinone biosynthesis protein B